MSETGGQHGRIGQYRMAARTWLAQNMAPAESVAGDKDLDRAAIDKGRLLQQKLWEAGYAGFTFPVEFGGQGLTTEHERVFREEALGYEMPPVSFGVSINIIGATLAAFGSDEQKREHLPAILSGKELWLQFLSEPSGGSDLAGLLTRATRDGDVFVVNGQKIWSTGAHLSDYALCPVRTRWDVPKNKGISMLMIDLRSPGVEIHRIKQIDGNAELCHEFLNDVVVPAANLVGEENGGWRVARGLLEMEHAWVGSGDARPSSEKHGVEALTLLVKARGMDADFGVRRKVVALHVASVVHELLTARVTDAIAQGKLPANYGSLLKLGNDTFVQRRAEGALALAGGAGVAWSSGDTDGEEWSHRYLHSRCNTIAGGTAEIQRNNVSERVLGLPREQSIDRDLPFNQVPHN